MAIKRAAQGQRQLISANRAVRVRNTAKLAAHANGCGYPGALRVVRVIRVLRVLRVVRVIRVLRVVRVVREFMALRVLTQGAQHAQVATT